MKKLEIFKNVICGLGIFISILGTISIICKLINDKKYIENEDETNCPYIIEKCGNQYYSRYNP